VEVAQPVKILLVAPPVMDYVNGALAPIAMDSLLEIPPYGLYLLGAVLRAQGHEVLVVDLIADGSNSLDPYLPHLSVCDLVGVGATSLSWPTARAVIRQVRQVRQDVPIVLGGIHPSMFDSYLLNTVPVDYVIRGEGELALVALCAELEHGGNLGVVPNLSWKNATGSIVRNPVAAKLTGNQLGLYPIPDFSTLPINRYKLIPIESSRGCAFDCSFCSTSYRRGWRCLAPEVFVDRLERLLPSTERVQVKSFHVIDDEFSTDPSRVIKIADLLRSRGPKPRFYYDARATDLLYKGFVESIGEFTQQLLVGAECGYDEGLVKTGKGTTTRIIEDAAKVLYQHDLAEHADFSFILGLPWETVAEVRQTCAFAADLYARYGVRIVLQWYCQIPGSRLWQADREAGLVCETMYDDHGFFRDLYLLRVGVKLSLAEIDEISTLVYGLMHVTQVQSTKAMVDYAHPSPMKIYFPKSVVMDHVSGLGSLRELSASGSDCLTSGAGRSS